MGNLSALDIYSLGTPDTSLSGLSTLKALRALASTPSTSRLDISMSKKPITLTVKNKVQFAGVLFLAKGPNIFQFFLLIGVRFKLHRDKVTKPIMTMVKSRKFAGFRR